MYFCIRLNRDHIFYHDLFSTYYIIPSQISPLCKAAKTNPMAALITPTNTAKIVDSYSLIPSSFKPDQTVRNVNLPPKFQRRAQFCLLRASMAEDPHRNTST